MNVNADTPDNASQREVWAKNSLYVSITRTASGGMIFEGDDLSPNPFGDSSYEYNLTVGRDDIATIIEALGGTDGDNLLDLVEANMEIIMQRGESSWLKSLGIEPGFWSHF